jgi:membrane protein
MLSTIWDVLNDAYQRFYADDGFPNSGNIAYCVMLAIFPFLIFVFALAAFFVDEALAQKAVDTLLDIAPHEIVKPLIPNIKELLTGQRSDLLTISGLITIWTSSRGVESLRTGLNRAYRFYEDRPFWLRVIQDMAIVVCGAALSLGLALTMVFAPAIWTLLVAYIPALGDFTFKFELVRYFAGFVLLTVGLVGGHLLLPSRRLPLAALWPGIVLTMITWLIIAAGYSLYLARFAYFASLYAGLGGLFAALIFLYLSAAIFQFGGEINRAVYARRNPGRNINSDFGGTL